MRHLRSRRAGLLAALAVLIASASSIAFAQASGPTGPGLPTAVNHAAPQAPNGDPLLVFDSESGDISLSVDAIGTNDPAGATIKVHKNAGATVRKAFLFAASTGFTGYTPVNGDVTLNGTPVTWDPTHTISNDIGSVNVEVDVTSIVKPVVDSAPTGDVNFTAAEPNYPTLLDGEILAVILDDPTVTTSGSVTLLYGAQQVAGDTFNVTLADPVDKTNPNFALNLGLGISYGCQGPTGCAGHQFSTVDANGTLMSSSAGGQDDCVQKYSVVPDFSQCVNGELITAGGIGDSNDDPPVSSATDSTCLSASGQPAPRCDDELYSLLPFVNNGDTTLTFTTTNPSDDDNIFFGALDVRSGAALVGAGVVLGPTSATNPVGMPHQLTATVKDGNGDPVQGVTVQFNVTSGPNAGTSGTGVTGANGQAQFSYTSSVAGTDHIVASFTDEQGVTHTSNEVTKTWQAVTTATGAFVVGDLSAVIGNSVTFWGAQWAKNNKFSGGSAPASMKGFADSVTALTCGSTWTSSPGNSSGPPQTLPSTIEVIVSKNVTKSGSTISGTITSIYQVQVSPGYGSNPGHVGNGIVTQKIC